jgi:hypothetical protein
MAEPSAKPPADAAGCLDAFLEVQAARAAAYAELEARFASYLATEEEAEYTAAIAAATAAMAPLSARVQALARALRAAGAAGAADIVDGARDAERRKLQATLVLHALRAAERHRRFSWLREEHAAHGAHGAAACGCVAPEGEPTEPEVSAARGAAVRELQECVSHINGAIDEARELRAELLGDG